MKITRLLLLATFALPASLLATPVCSTQSLATYISYGVAGCTVGTDFVFDNFSYINASVLANGVNASDITVSVTNVGNNPSFTFAANWSTNPILGTYVGLLGFRGLSSNDAFSAFNALGLRDTGSSGNSVLNVNTVSEVDCAGGVLNPAGLACLSGGVGVNLNAKINKGEIGAAAVVSFAPSDVVDVLKIITLASVLGTDSISSISQDFTTGRGTAATPEPVSMTLMGAGLLVAGAFGRRKQLALRARK